MSSLKLKHSGGNSVIIAGPSSNPAADRTINLNDNYAGNGSFVTANSSGNVGINTSSPSHQLHVESSASGVIAAKQTTNNGGYNTFEGKDSSGNVKFYATHNGRVGAADGIIFGSDTAAANILNDYEEGLHTATLTCTSSGTITLDTNYNQLAYTKIGNWVNVYGRIRVTSTSSPSGQQLRVSLPFQSATLAEDAGRVYGTAAIQLADENENHYGIQPTSNAETFVQIGNINTNTTNPADVCSQVNSNSLVAINVSYRTV